MTISLYYLQLYVVKHEVKHDSLSADTPVLEFSKTCYIFLNSDSKKSDFKLVRTNNSDHK